MELMLFELRAKIEKKGGGVKGGVFLGPLNSEIQAFLTRIS